MAPIDTSFKFYEDCRPGLDPDRWSPTLHRYHRVLWGRPLPNGTPFTLTDARPRRGYLSYRAADGVETWLASDAVMQTFTRWRRPGLAWLQAEISADERAQFYDLAYTIGAMMIFPHTPGSRLWTLNQARGLRAQIADRMDLTLECIRRHYLGEPSPLQTELDRFHGWFDLFETFDAYVEHFLLHDLVEDDGASVRFFLASDDFIRPSVPRNVAEWREFRDCSVEFIRARNARVDALHLDLT